MDNKRFEKIMDYIPQCTVLADIGTDHGYIPMKAIMLGRADKVIASDLSKASLERAMREVEKHQLQEHIEGRQGDGLEVLTEEEADVIVIAGLGGNLIGDILRRGYHKKYQKTFPLFVFQPVQFPEKLRANLYQLGFDIEDEDLVKEDGLIYHLITARKSTENLNEPTDIELEFGKKNIEKDKQLLWELIEYKIQTYEKIVLELSEKKTSRSIDRVNELLAKIRDYSKLMEQLVERRLSGLSFE